MAFLVLSLMSLPPVFCFFEALFFLGVIPEITNSSKQLSTFIKLILKDGSKSWNKLRHNAMF